MKYSALSGAFISQPPLLSPLKAQGISWKRRKTVRDRGQQGLGEAHMNSQQLCLFAKDLGKDKSLSSLAWIGKGHTSSHS